MTRKVLITVLALIAGFALGIAVSEVIGIVGVLAFGRAMGIKYLPVYLAVLAAVAANVVDMFVRRRSRKVNPE